MGVNNRNLKDFTVDTNNSARLRQMIPSDVLFVSESGVKDADDVPSPLPFGTPITSLFMKRPPPKQFRISLRSPPLIGMIPVAISAAF